MCIRDSTHTHTHTHQVYRHDCNFAKSFLVHLKGSLQAERVRASRVECEVVTQAYAECFLFFLTALNLNASEQRDWFEDAAVMVGCMIVMYT